MNATALDATPRTISSSVAYFLPADADADLRDRVARCEIAASILTTAASIKRDAQRTWDAVKEQFGERYYEAGDESLPLRQAAVRMGSAADQAAGLASNVICGLFVTAGGEVWEVEGTTHGNAYIDNAYRLHSIERDGSVNYDTRGEHGHRVADEVALVDVDGVFATAAEAFADVNG